MRLRSLIPVGLVASVFLVGCDDAGTNPPSGSPTDSAALSAVTDSSSKTPSDKPSGVKPTSGEVAVASDVAADAFQTMFRKAENDAIDPANPVGSSRASLQIANTTLRSAWSTDNSDSRAAFGLAITSLALKLNDMAGTMKRAQDNGLSLALFEGTSTSSGVGVVEAMPALARAMAAPAKAPLIHEMQDSLELLLLPTLDEAVKLLGVSWADSAFDFRVALDPDLFYGDTLVIDHSDVGFALSILQAVRAQIRWMISYNVDVDLGGSYAWTEDLSSITDFGSMSTAQNAAAEHLKSLVSNTSSFLKVRSGKADVLASVPVELKASLERMRKAAYEAYVLKHGKQDHILTITTTADRDAFVRVVDSALSLLSGPKDFVLYANVTCKDSSWTTVTNEDGVKEVVGGYSNTWKNTSPFGLVDRSCDVYSSSDVWADREYHYVGSQTTSYTQTVRMDISKLLVLPDLKVFLPQFQWYATSEWKANGPFALLDKSGAKTSFVDLDKKADELGYDGVKSSIYWADPTFGGVFPEFKSSLDVMECFRKAIDEDGDAVGVAARGPLVLF